MKRRRLFRWFLIFLAVAIPLNIAFGAAASFWVIQKLRNGALPGVKFSSVRWNFPVGVAVYGITIPDPSGLQDFLLRVDRVTLQVPWWGVLVWPMPVRIVFQNPYLKVGSENANALIGEMASDPEDWFKAPFRGISQGGRVDGRVRSFSGILPILPVGIRVLNGRLDAIEPEIRSGLPVFTAANVDLSLELVAAGLEPAIRLRSHGDFVSPDGQVIGKQEVDILAKPRRMGLQGSIRLRHEHLGDFRNLYQYAPRPLYIDGGIADFLLQFTVTDGRHVRMTASTLVQNLDLSGMVQDVSWAAIMHAVEDENRVYRWSVSTEGDLDNPAFNPHDYVLDEVEWKMKEKAASRGLEIPGQMFFYADTPGVDE